MKKYKTSFVQTKENINLINYIKFLANNSSIGYLTYDDYFYAGLEGILKSEKYFDPTRNIKYTTFAKRVIFNEIASLINHCKRTPVQYNDELTFCQDLISYDPTNEYDSKILLANIQHKFTPREKKVIVYLLQGYKIKDVCKLTNLKYKTVDNIMQSIKRKIKNSEK